MNNNLFNKYDVPAPRYTSYPTVPYWSEDPTPEDWLGFLNKNFNQAEPTKWALYVHIPFCETLCTFCGCNTSITKNHKREEPYMDLLMKEWGTYNEKIEKLKDNPLVEFHYGGGTPTFLSAKNLGILTETILKQCTVDASEFSGAIEVDPRRTSIEQLQVLKGLGFNRISLGVQDFDPETQRLINRIQPFDMTQKLTDAARDMGYESVNFDLIYGLPAQTLEKIEKMMDLTLQLRPDRIALYSLAVVPWIKPAQKLFKDEDLPQGKEKRHLYEISRERLLSAGYLEIGMDHFALPEDSLSKALAEKKLHRNFMGYAHHRSQVLLGLGVSAISETPECFHQNEKKLPMYEASVNEGSVPTFRGHILSQQDRLRREQILKFMTLGEVELEGPQVNLVQDFLQEMLVDNLVKVENSKMVLMDAGRPFLRNACMVLDERLRSKSPTSQVFSRSL